MENNPLENNDSNAINDSSDITLGRQSLYQSFVSAITENRVIDTVIETSDSISVSFPIFLSCYFRLFNGERYEQP
jgi:hypothetical protein